MKKLIILTTETGNREDCSVFYSEYFLVESTGELNFSEEIFNDSNNKKIDFQDVKSLGYNVESLDSIVFCDDYSSDDEWDEDEEENDYEPREIPVVNIFDVLKKANS